jgi:hypothetical protein
MMVLEWHVGIEDVRSSSGTTEKESDKERQEIRQQYPIKGNGSRVALQD